jgi:hypothetical protein
MPQSGAGRAGHTEMPRLVAAFGPIYEIGAFMKKNLRPAR